VIANDVVGVASSMTFLGLEIDISVPRMRSFHHLSDSCSHIDSILTGQSGKAVIKPRRTLCCLGTILAFSLWQEGPLCVQ
jgi:hypothetical protein